MIYFSGNLVIPEKAITAFSIEYSKEVNKEGRPLSARVKVEMEMVVYDSPQREADLQMLQRSALRIGE